MDTTETYIKMCQKAAEIQAVEHDEEHQFYAAWPSGGILSEDDGCYFGFGAADSVWLPRQDQLQEMVSPSECCPIALIGKVANYGSIPMWMNTWEQFWLSLVMAEKYGKRWLNDDWVKD